MDLSFLDFHYSGLDHAGMAKLLEAMQPFRQMMMRYECALMEVKTKVEVLDREFASRYQRNPVEHISTRLKSPLSILEKLERKGFEVNFDNIQNEIHDVAGIRIVCTFQNDIYAIADLLMNQDDVTVLRIKDYIKTPKENGYRSLHLLLGVPVFLSSGKQLMCVEVQIRTVAMDFWASLDHKLRYKRELENEAEITARMSKCATVIAALDDEMQNIHRTIFPDGDGL